MSNVRVLIMGLPGAGKTVLAREIFKRVSESGISVDWVNADAMREKFNDWDFSEEGRLRQAHRMREYVDMSSCNIAIADFIAPTQQIRDIFSPTFTVWADTIDEGRFADTNKVFVPPEKYDIRMTDRNFLTWEDTVSMAVESLTKLLATDSNYAHTTATHNPNGELQ